MKLEVYQVGKVPPLTIVECDHWEAHYDYNTPRVICFEGKKLSQCFLLITLQDLKKWWVRVDEQRFNQKSLCSMGKIKLD